MTQKRRLPKRLATSAAILGAVGALTLATSTPAAASGGRGLTWGWYSHDPALGIDHVGNAGTANPYTGDTLCKFKRPILCIDVDGSARPNYVDSSASGFYEGWVEGHYTTTIPIAGTSLSSQAAGDSYCAHYFGTGWRMAEFHDAAYTDPLDQTHNWGTPIQNPPSPWQSGYPHGGHTARGYGHIRNDTRYWVAINDQPGNCWNP